MKNIKCLLFLLLSLSVFAFEFGPLGFDKRVDNGEGYGEFVLANRSNEIVRYKISASSTGKVNDISQFINIYPKILTIPAHSEGKFKVYAEVPKNYEKGIYSFVIGMQTVGVPFLQEIEDGKVAPGVSMQAAVNVEMEAHVGNMDKDFSILDKKIYKQSNSEGKQENMIAFTLKNETGRGYEIGIGFSDVNGALMDIEAKGRIQNNHSMNITLKIPKEAKKLVFYDFNNRKLVGQSISIDMR